MNKRAKYELRFGGPIESWTEAQKDEALEELLPARGKAGRPKKADLATAQVKYVALAYEVAELRASPEGAKMSPETAMRRVILASLAHGKAEQVALDEDIRRAEAAGQHELVKVLRLREPVPIISKRDLTPAMYHTAERGLRAARRGRNAMAAIFGAAAV
ncbi:MAG: hypothetical protein ABMA14_05885 [Hyphomonadaceae bacterium]